MNPRATRLEALFDAAFDLGVADRARFLETVDPALRDDLIKLLEADSHTSPVDKPAPGMADAAAVFCLPEEIQSTISAGQQIGHYRLIRLLGEGGMASVWLAERDDGTFSHQVAVKCLKTGLMTPESHNRFLREQQILARLQHPNIARLYDAGISSDGVPFIVMEWIDGNSLIQYCDTHQLGIDKRLKLFQKIGTAVSFAHQNLIVHRDIKPGNVLIGKDAEPKLLDFGIAKLLDDQSSAMTRTGLHLLTPEYAAPEQFNGEDITTATDVYALGAVLYELLSGLRSRTYIPGKALDITTPVTAPSEALKRNTKKPPGTKAHTLDESKTVERLSRLLRGDLDTIILKALQNDPHRRYATVQALNEDIDRYLNQQPIRARKDTWTYRTRKFLQRHAGAVALATLVVIALVTATGISLYQARRAELQTERAESEAQRAHTEADHAQAEAKRAAAVKNFLSNLFEVSDVGLPRTEIPNTATLLQDGAKRIRNEFNDAPELKLDLLLLIAKIQTNLGLYEPAENLLKDAKELAEATLSPDHEAWLQTQTQLATLLLKRSHYIEAAELLEPAITKYQASGISDSAILAEALVTMGEIYAQLDRFDESIAVTRQALEHFKRLFGEHDAHVQQTLVRLGNALSFAKRWEEAEPILKANVGLSRELYGEHHAKFAESLRMLATQLHNRGNPAEAEPLIRQALHIAETVYDRPNADFVDMLILLGTLLSNQHRLDEARAITQRALEMQTKLSGTDNSNMVAILDTLIMINLYQEHASEAERLSQQSLQLIRKYHGNNSSKEANLLIKMAFSLSNQERNKEALAKLQKALEINQILYGEDNEATAVVLANIAYLELHTNPKLALQHSEAAMHTLEQRVDADNRGLLETRAIRGFALRRSARYAEAKAWLMPLIAHMRKANLPEKSPNMFEICLMELGRTQFALHETEAALANWNEILTHNYSSSTTNIAETKKLIALASKSTEKLTHP